MAERREYIGKLICAGPARTMTGEPGRYVVTAEAIRRAVEDGLFRGLACFADHAAEGPSVRRLVGVWHDVEWQAAPGRAGDGPAGAAVGRLATYETGDTRPVLDLLDQWLGDAAGPEAGPAPDVGVSLVFYPVTDGDGRTVRRIAMVESADLVMFPASAGSRIHKKMTDEDLRMARGAGAATGGFDSHSQSGNNRHAAAANRGQHPGRGIRPDREERVRAARPTGGRLQKENSGSGQTNKESRQMAHEEESERAGLERVALVSERRGATAGGGEEGRAPGDDGRAATDGLPDARVASLYDWVEALRASAATAIIRSSGLPAAVQERLGEGRYEQAEDVYAAVERARGELAALNEAGVIRLGGRPPRGVFSHSGLMSVRDPLDEARELVGFFFGAAGAATPPPNLRSFGDLYVALTGDAHFRGVFDGDRALFSGATTATLPNLAADAMNRVIVQQFQALEHYRWYERIAAVEPNDGRLHDMKWLTLGGIGALPAVDEGAAYTELSVADARESASFVKRGGYVGITREMIKNSDIMQLQAIPRALAAAAVRTRSAAVAALFTANSGVGPTLAQDSKALFHADHDNLETTALGTDAAAWRAARAECFKHAEVGSGAALGIYPRFLLVPADLYDRALSILGYGEGMPATYTPEAQGRGFADPRPIPLVVPDWTDATDWAYIVDPAVYPVVQMSYSQAPGGRQHPIPELFAVVSETSGLLFSNDVLPIKVRDEFALGVNGPRGIGKRNVA